MIPDFYKEISIASCRPIFLFIFN